MTPLPQPMAPNEAYAAAMELESVARWFRVAATGATTDVIRGRAEAQIAVGQRALSDLQGAMR